MYFRCNYLTMQFLTPMTSKEFDSYIIYHENNPKSNIHMTVHCFNGEKSVGYIRFYGGDIPNPEVLPGGSIEIGFSASRINELVNTLRFEKPLYISAEGSKGMVSTVKEPVGEQEGH